MPERSHTFAWIAAALVVVAVGYRLLADRTPQAPAVAVTGAAAGGEQRARPRRPKRRVYVHVAGAVRRPGLYLLRDGARVATAIGRAGGAKPKADLTAVNLAAKVQDGQQIVVAVRGRAPAPVASAPGGAAPGAGPISLATATQEQLEELDGIGPALASRIIEYRDAHGGFHSVDELGEVDGIGDVRLEALRQAVQP